MNSHIFIQSFTPMHTYTEFMFFHLCSGHINLVSNYFTHKTHFSQTNVFKYIFSIYFSLTQREWQPHIRYLGKRLMWCMNLISSIIRFNFTDGNNKYTSIRARISQCCETSDMWALRRNTGPRLRRNSLGHIIFILRAVSLCLFCATHIKLTVNGSDHPILFSNLFGTFKNQERGEK